MDPAVKKRLVPVSIVVGVLVAVIVLGLFLSREKAISTGAQFFVSPTDATLRIGDTRLQPNSRGIVELAPGEYKIEIEREYFEPQSQGITVKQGEIYEMLVMLEVIYEEGLEVLSRPGEPENRESISYRISQRKAQEVESKNPIITLLPAYNNEFRIDYGATGKDGRISIFITTDVVSQRELALNWIRSKGYKPEDLNITYRFYDDL